MDQGNKWLLYYINWHNNNHAINVANNYNKRKLIPVKGELLKREVETFSRLVCTSIKKLIEISHLMEEASEKSLVDRQ